MSKSKVISFRLTDEQIAPFQDAISSAKNQSAFFKALILTRSPDEAAASVVKGTKEFAHYNFLLYKTSNNINQIAKVLNTLSKSNFTDKAALYKALNNIHTLETTLKSKIL